MSFRQSIGGIGATMRRETSVYLDLLRFTAAFVVLLGHFGTQLVSAGVLWQMRRYGEPAVLLFFVISGYVVSFVLWSRHPSGASYFINRASRLYSVVVPGLLLIFLLDHVGMKDNPDFYNRVPRFDASLESYLTSAVFANQVWDTVGQPGSDVPYWSLGYEVPYYAFVGLACFAPRPWRVFAVLAAMAAVGPRVVSLFPVWLLGFAAHRISTRGWVGRRTGLALAAAAVLLLVAIDVVMRLLHMAVPNLFNLHNYRYLWIDYLIGLLIALHLIGVAAAPGGVGFLVRPFAGAIHWLAGATFTIYVFHYPVMHLLAATVPGARSLWLSRAIILFGTILSCFALAEVTERRKAIWRRFFTWLVDAALSQARRQVAPEHRGDQPAPI